jgi:hypothetical protein
MSSRPRAAGVRRVSRADGFGLLAAALAVTAVVTSLARAQATPDLSGLWTMDAGKSASGLSPTPMPPGRRADSTVTLAANQIFIAQTPAELVLEQGTQAAVYKLDGAENWSPSLKSTAKWDAAKLVVSWKREVYLGPRAGQGAFETQSGTDVYALAGNVLTVDRTITTPKGTQTGKVVYNKSPE